MRNLKTSVRMFLIIFVILLSLSCVIHSKIFTAPEIDLTSYKKTVCEDVTGVKSGIKSSMLIKNVDPFIGTSGHGHTFPGATVPFGMVQVSPDNGVNGWDWCSGYHWYAKEIVYFSHKHLSGTGCTDLGDIGFMPIMESRNVKSSFSHENEYAHPGYYAVKLDNEILVELTASKRGAVHRYSYPKNRKQRVVIDLQHYIGSPFLLSSKFSKIDDRTISGYRYSTGWAKSQKVFFVAKFSKPITSITGIGARRVFSFNNKSQILEINVALSSVSEKSALLNLKKEVADFDTIKVKAENSWEKELNKIKVETTDSSLMNIFYSSLYHSFIAPNLLSDVDGRYREADGTIIKCEGFDRYSTFSLWDTYRAANPLYLLTQPELTSDFVNSMLNHYDKRGYLPIWELEANETFCMIGNHSVPVIVEAVLKGIGGFDIEKAYEACYATLMQESKGMDDYIELGYIPFNKEAESVSKALEYCYDDWCMSQFAKKMNRDTDYDYFIKRSLNYKNHFDNSIGFMRPKDSNGKWLSGFDPLSHQQGTARHFTEGNSWQHSWNVQHDIEGLKSLLGGEDKFIDKLDKLFDESNKHSGVVELVDVTGLIGQYAHGNEPSHHVAYLYNWTSQPWKTQKLINQICTSFYTEDPNGYCGNEDCGQMSAWYVFSSLGIYPVDPVSNHYYFGSPLFDKVELNLPNKKVFTIIRKNGGEDSPYIQKIKLNGLELNRLYITYNELTSGGELVFVMGEKPLK